MSYLLFVNHQLTELCHIGTVMRNPSYLRQGLELSVAIVSHIYSVGHKQLAETNLCVNSALCCIVVIIYIYYIYIYIYYIYISLTLL